MRVGRTLPPAAAPLALKDLWKGLKGFFAGGEYLGRLEEGIREYFGVSHVWLTSSGKAALYVILRSLSSLRPDRKEVLIPAYTCFSVPSAIIRAGLEVALCDIDASSLDFDDALLKRSINARTLCVVPNHLFGIPSRMGRIMDICRDRQVPVLEDGAQAMGGRHGGRLLGTIGDVGFFSLGRGKPVTCGSGGIILTNCDILAGAIEREFSAVPSPGRAQEMKEYMLVVAMSLFLHPALYWLPAALPFLKLGRTIFDTRFPVERLSAAKAGLCLDWEERLKSSMEVRGLKAAALCRKMRISESRDGASAFSYLRLPVIVESSERKAAICAAAREKGLGVTQMYPSAVDRIPEIAGGFYDRAFPVATRVAERLVTVPVHEFVSTGDEEEIARLMAPVGGDRMERSARRSSITLPVPGLDGRERSADVL